MRTLRYDTSGHWFKGNTHIHSTASDGGKTFSELARMYAKEKYDFLYRTDHWVASDVDADRASYPLTWFDGTELHGCDATGAMFHVVCLGRFVGLVQGMPFLEGLDLARNQGGLLILAHPHWCGNSLEDARRLGFHGVEIYNHVCHWLNGKSNGLRYWEAMLARNPGTLAFAVDDAHISRQHPGWNGGWVMVNAATCTAEAVTTAISAGNFYSSCGPEFHRISWAGGYVCLETSPVQFLRVVGPAWLSQPHGSFKREFRREWRVRVPSDWPFAYIEIEDDRGRRAWTNTLFLDA